VLNDWSAPSRNLLQSSTRLCATQFRQSAEVGSTDGANRVLDASVGRDRSAQNRDRAARVQVEVIAGENLERDFPEPMYTALVYELGKPSSQRARAKDADWSAAAMAKRRAAG